MNLRSFSPFGLGNNGWHFSTVTFVLFITEAEISNISHFLMFKNKNLFSNSNFEVEKTCQQNSLKMTWRNCKYMWSCAKGRSCKNKNYCKWTNWGRTTKVIEEDAVLKKKNLPRPDLSDNRINRWLERSLSAVESNNFSASIILTSPQTTLIYIEWKKWIKWTLKIEIRNRFIYQLTSTVRLSCRL